MANIFEYRRLTPAQARTVADRRLGDAECLRKTGENARSNGVFYLGGLVIDCLLKAALLEQHPHLRVPIAAENLSRMGRKVQSLIHRSHDLTEMLAALPEIQARIKLYDEAHGTDWFRQLVEICDRWTVFARYSPSTELMSNAAGFLGRVRELRQWLK